MAREHKFDTSPAFRRQFNQQFEQWKMQNHSSLKELAELCGVSASYMSHVSRYGRIPSKSVLILLALNFGITDPENWYASAGIVEKWPYPRNVSLSTESNDHSSFVSVKVDLPGLTDAIKEIVRNEIRPRRISELLENRTIKFGTNIAQWLFFNPDEDTSERRSQFFPDLLERISTAFQMTYTPEPVPFTKSHEQLEARQIDMYGPLYNTPPRMGDSLFSRPFCKVQVSGVMRTSNSKSLYSLEAPYEFGQLLAHPYVIGVLKGSASEHFVQGHLAGGQCTVLQCETPAELVERLLLSEIPFPIHCMICDAFVTEQLTRKHDQLQPIFHHPEKSIGYFENCLVVRPDWPEVLEPLNNLLDYLNRENILHELARRTIPEHYLKFVRF